LAIFNSYEQLYSKGNARLSQQQLSLLFSHSHCDATAERQYIAQQNEAYAYSPSPKSVGSAAAVVVAHRNGLQLRRRGCVKFAHRSLGCVLKQVASRTITRNVTIHSRRMVTVI